MARRMFSPKIVESDAFLDMPISTQALYFHLGMESDDDGFVNPKRTMRLIGASEDDLKVLITKRFVLPFESGVIVIKHWKINNLIRKDFYKPTLYIEEKAQLDTKTNGAYTELQPENVNKMLTKCKHSIVKYSIVNNNTPVPEQSSVKVFSLQDELKKLETDKQRSNNIIGFILEEKLKDGLDIATPEKYKLAFRRYLKVANDLKHYDNDQLLKALDAAKKVSPGVWTGETLLKMLTK